MVLWLLQGLHIDHKDGFCGYIDRPGTTKVV